MVIRFDPDDTEIDVMDGLLEPHIDDTNRLDIEKFIYSLPFIESVVLLFLSLGFKRREIKDIIGYKRVGNVNQAVLRLREKSAQEQFK